MPPPSRSCDLELVVVAEVEPERGRVDVHVAGVAVIGVDVDRPPGSGRRRRAGRSSSSTASRSASVSWKRQRAEVLKRRLRAADLVESGEQRGDRVRVVEVPRAELVLLRVEVLLGARPDGAVFEQLEGRTVDAPVGRQRGGQDRAAHEHRSAAVLELVGEDVGRVGPGVRPVVIDRAGGEVGEVLAQLPCLAAPGEVGVRLGEAELGEPLHDPGRVNASARKIVSGCSRRIELIAHSQKANALVCGLSTRKIVTPRSTQNRNTSARSCHSACQS